MSNQLYIQTGLHTVTVVDQDNERVKVLLARLEQMLNVEAARVRKELTLAQLGEIETIYSAINDEGTPYTGEQNHARV